MDTWYVATSNWSELCVAMGCDRINIPGALVHIYPVERSGTFYNFALVQDPKRFHITDVEDEFAERQLPFAIRIPRLGLYTELEKSLREHEYSLVPAWNLMTCENRDGKMNPEVRVEVIDRSKLPAWFSVEDMFSQVQSSKKAREDWLRGHY